MKALVVGWFSFERMGATAGDLMARDVVCDWLIESGTPFDVATAEPFRSGIALNAANPSDYSHLVFVCGPFGKSPEVQQLMERFAGCSLIGLDLSMLDPIEAWNPFDHLIERDSSRRNRPDISFLARVPCVPLVGVVLVHKQSEYGKRGRHEIANAAFDRLIAAHDMATVAIDTRLDANGTGLRTPAEVESVIARMDIVLTTRLHGLALAIKHGVPVIAIDAIAGGAKVTSQGLAIGWPLVFGAESVTDDQLIEAFVYCRTEAARSAAADCRRRAIQMVRDIRHDFLTAIAQPLQRGRR